MGAAVFRTSQLFLGIETSGPGTGLALATPTDIRFEAIQSGESNHNERLLPLIQEALSETEAAVAELGGIGVTIGPGMFTALRVGLSVAKGLALAHAIPIKGISTLWALVRSLDWESASSENRGCPVLALIDARKHQVYAAVYLGKEVLIRPAVLEPAELVSLIVRLNLRRLRLVGNGIPLCRPVLEAAGIAIEATDVRFPRPAVVAQEAARLIQLEGGDDVARLTPCYLRPTDAELHRVR
ncbi:MAG: tRNA (adenosine(37)-N6)-threonylcarbamoyltransferase complex dimerization subunit type 1 TsaB [candidate division WOR-3 bacterium]